MNAIFSCREASRLASEALDHPLGLGRRFALGMHLMMCAACRAYRRQIGILDHVVRSLALSGAMEAPAEETLEDAARARILSGIVQRGGWSVEPPPT